MDNYFAYLIVFLISMAIVLVGDLIISMTVYAIFADADACVVKNFRAGYYTFLVPIVLLTTLVLGSKQSLAIARNNLAKSETKEAEKYYGVRAQQAEKFENDLTDVFRTISGFKIRVK